MGSPRLCLGIGDTPPLFGLIPFSYCLPLSVFLEPVYFAFGDQFCLAFRVLFPPYMYRGVFLGDWARQANSFLYPFLGTTG